MTTAACPRCRRGVPLDAAFCTSCGASLRHEVEIELEDVGPAAGDEVVLGSARRRGRWAGAGVAVALVAAIGASIASGGDDRTAPTSTSPLPSPTTGPSSTVASTVAPSLPTTAPAPTTSTTIEVDGQGPPLLGEPTGASLLLTSSRGLLRLDLDTGRATVVDVGGSPAFVEDLVPVRGGFVGWSQGVSRVYRYDARPDPTEPSDTQLLGGDSSGRAWVLVYRNDGIGTVSLGLVADARSRIEPIKAPWTFEGYPPLPDGTGAVLHNMAGGVFRWEPGGQPVPFAPGSVMDAANGFVLTRLCYPDPTCTLTVTDVRGAAPPRVLPDLSEEPSRVLRISPDGRWVVARLSNSAGSPGVADPLVLHEVATGRTVVLPSDDGDYLRNSWMISRLAWTTDHRWLFYVAGPRAVLAWHDGLAEPVRIEFPTETLSGAVAVEVPG